eukprot:1193009-Prorocentrum_minimum.AAC.2
MHATHSKSGILADEHSKTPKGRKGAKRALVGSTSSPSVCSERDNRAARLRTPSGPPPDPLLTAFSRVLRLAGV